MTYDEQVWDTNSVFTPSRMNHIEKGIAGRIDFEDIGVPISVYDPTSKSILQYLTDANTPVGFSIIRTQNASDNPRGNRVSYAVVFKGNSNGTNSRVTLFELSRVFVAGTGGSIPSSLTWYEIDADGIHTRNEATPNTSYVGGTQNKLYWVQSGGIVTLSGRFEITTEKPSGQNNYLFKDLPIPRGIAPMNTGSNDFIIVNASGYLTSNNAVGTGYVNIAGSYVCG